MKIQERGGGDLNVTFIMTVQAMLKLMKAN